MYGVGNSVVQVRDKILGLTINKNDQYRYFHLFQVSCMI